MVSVVYFSLDVVEVMLLTFNLSAGSFIETIRWCVFLKNFEHCLNVCFIFFLLCVIRTGLDLQYTYKVKYELTNLSLSKLVKASFMHLRSPVSSHLPFICEARVTPSQNFSEGDDHITMGPRSLWTESDVTNHVSQSKGDHVFLFAHYRCTKTDHKGFIERKHLPPQNHLRAPVLLLFLEENKQPMEWAKYFTPLSRPSTRTRRSREPGSIVSDIPNYKQGPNSVAKNQCKLHSYRVAFKDLGWDHWIIAPHKYNPRYCMGDCPRILHYGYNSPNHAIMQTFISDLGVADIPLPSCVPYKYKPISVLMMERNGNIVYKEYEDMIADSCTCRWLWARVRIGKELNCAMAMWICTSTVGGLK